VVLSEHRRKDTDGAKTEVLIVSQGEVYEKGKSEKDLKGKSDSETMYSVDSMT